MKRKTRPEKEISENGRAPQKRPAKGPMRDVPAVDLAALQKRLGHEFENGELLTLALTHSSFIYEERLGRAKNHGDEPNQPGTDNEQLEFLGDAVLGLAVTELLLRTFPNRTEGELTRMRAALVSRKRMAELGESLQLGTFLRMGKSAEATEGRQRLAVLANTSEAVFGAVYLDVARNGDARARSGEKALKTVRGIIDRLLVEPDLPGIRAALEAAPGRGALRDAKSRLQERVQAVGIGKLQYADTGETGPAHERQFTVEVRLEGKDGSVRALAKGKGGSKKEAQQAAADVALQRWEDEPACD
jgi:ribonuclease-3